MYAIRSYYATSKTPSLLTFSEVQTFLHEFGHALHGMLSKVTYQSLSGTNVYRDFVELPSQILENWATQKEWLQDVGVHYKTGEVIPEAMIQKLIASDNFQSGYATLRQLSFGFTDMAWHSLQKPLEVSVLEFEKTAMKATELFPSVEGTALSTAFSHIFDGGYAAGYYGYKWAEVLDARITSYNVCYTKLLRVRITYFLSAINSKTNSPVKMSMLIHIMEL